MILQNPSFQLTTCRRKQSAVAALLCLAPSPLAGNLKFSVFAKYISTYNQQQIRQRREVEAGGVA